MKGKEKWSKGALWGEFREISVFSLTVKQPLSPVALLRLLRLLPAVCVTLLGLVQSKAGGNKGSGRGRRRSLWLRNVPERKNMAIKG